jgi:hypothetical protein
VRSASCQAVTNASAQDDIRECPNSLAWALLDVGIATVWCLLVDGKVYDIRDDLNRPSWQNPDGRSMGGGPQAMREMNANPLDQM